MMAITVSGQENGSMTCGCRHPLLRTHHIDEVVEPLAVAGGNVDVGSHIKAHVQCLQPERLLSGNVYGGTTFSALQDMAA